MSQQDIYQTCISYGACVEAYIRTSIEDAKNGCAPDEQLAAQMLLLELELMKAGVEIDSEERRKEIRKRIDESLKA
jgi:hypothetical protein